MNPDKFTYNTQKTVNEALEIAVDNNHPELTIWHIALALLKSNEGIISELLVSAKIDQKSLLRKIEEKIRDLPKTANRSQPVVSFEVQELFKNAQAYAYKFGDQFLSREHLFLALITSPSFIKIAENFKIDKDFAEKIIMNIRGNQRVTDQNPEEKYNALRKYTVNFTSLARQGKLDPVIGRDNEIRRVMQVLSRRTKNNPVLLGDPGVGKTAIVEGLAQRIASGDVPDNLKNREILSLDLASILAGAKFRGEFEERLKTIINEIEINRERYILFIDELHTLVGAGGAEGAIDASNMLKPFLARGLLRTIGATTVREYRQYIEKDAALERRFQPIFIDEPSVEDTIAILRGLKEKYEAHHGIRISDDALIAASTLSKRYITDRFLPDKAIDLIDEAAAGIKIETQSMPSVLDSLKRKITQVEIELAALKKERSEQAEIRKRELEKKLAGLREKERELNLTWTNQKEIIDKLHRERAKLDSLHLELDKAEREILLEEAAKLKYGEIPKSEQRIKELEKMWNKIPDEKKMLREEVTDEDIAKVVSRWTGIPVTRLLASEGERLVNLERELKKRVVGQDEALMAVAKAIRRNRVGITEGNRPIGVFLFLGPTGVGKTETAKALAYQLFDSDEALVRIDMSEYQEEYTIARLIGAPPGYIGYEEGGQLTEKVRRKPYCVILFDEIEKANPSIYNLFLQIFDDGRLTDGKGRTVDFKNTIIIMTSNLGSDIIQMYEKKPSILQNKMWTLLQKRFPPEFLNRIDQIVIFNSLDNTLIRKIVDLHLKRFAQRLREKEIFVSFTKEVIDFLSKVGFDTLYGARPLKRAITQYIEDQLATLLIEGKLKKQEAILITCKNDKIVIEKQSK